MFFDKAIDGYSAFVIVEMIKKMAHISQFFKCLFNAMHLRFNVVCLSHLLGGYAHMIANLLINMAMCLRFNVASLSRLRGG